jgi:hypothetical protein
MSGDRFVGRVQVVTGAASGIGLACSKGDYRENPWGDYNEVNLGFLARPPDFCTWGEDGCATFQLGQQV